MVSYGCSGAKADYTSEEDEEGSDIELNRAKRLEKAKAALKDSDEESEKSKQSSRCLSYQQLQILVYIFL
jgi:uncharacterized protein (DUF3084 family)